MFEPSTKGILFALSAQHTSVCFMHAHVYCVYVLQPTRVHFHPPAATSPTFDVADSPLFYIFQTKPKIQRRRKGDRRETDKSTGIQLGFHNPLCEKKYTSGQKNTTRDFRSRWATVAVRLKQFSVAKWVWQ